MLNKTECSRNRSYYGSLKKQFIDTVQKKIISGEWPADTQLPPERELAKQMGLSRSLVNVGLMELQSQGFVKIIPRQGNFVVDIHRDGSLSVLAAVMNYNSDNIELEMFNNMMDTRSLIERDGTRLAAKKGTAEDFHKLIQHIEEMEDADTADDFCEAVFRFHYNLMQASQNSIYIMIYRSFEPILRCLMWNHYSTGITDKDTYIEQHRRLVELLQQGDAIRADECLQGILRVGVSALRKKYEKKEIETKEE
ncbi:MAG: FCD domain-containing protein [Paludibacter sp.]|nr:FCD domain-containing protein [Paludibacter sp.]